MANEQCPAQGYAHKKFNSGYTHKKFGKRPATREVTQQSDMAENTAITVDTAQTTATPITRSNGKELFRPYAIGEDTPRKRKRCDVTQDHVEFEAKTVKRVAPSTTTTGVHHQKVTIFPAQHLPPASQPQPQLAPHFALDRKTLAIIMQKQRAALYMRQLMQISSGGYAWPTLMWNAAAGIQSSGL